MRSRALFTVSLGCALALAAPAIAAAEIAPTSLVAHAGELPGFGEANIKLKSATSAARYVKVVFGEKGSEARKEAARLKRKHFREGVQELLSIRNGEALSLALVFGSARVAKQELKDSRSETVKAQGKAVVDPFTVPAIPGSFAFTATEGNESSVAANVLFATGRCYFVVGDSLEGVAITREQASAAPVAGATALYSRVKSLCS
jgi:hypothetical protein